MEYSNREISTAILFVIFVFYAIYRLKKRKLNLIDIKSDHLVLTRLLLGEFIIYADEIKKVTIISNSIILIKTEGRKYTIDDCMNLDEIIQFSKNNNLPIRRENLSDGVT